MNSLLSSRLYDNDSFYNAFSKDLRHTKQRVLIESPFITTKRISILLPTLRKLRQQGINIVVNTHNPEGHDAGYQQQAVSAVYKMQKLDVTVLYTVKLHRKLAVIDMLLR